MLKASETETKDAVPAAVNQEFWDKLAAHLRHAAIFGKHAADVAPWDYDGNNLDDIVISPEDEAAYDDEQQAIDAAVRSHRLTRLADAYETQADTWLTSSQTDAALKDVAVQWMEQAGRAVGDPADYEDAALELKDLLTVIDWYHTLISTKLRRALRGHIERERQKKARTIPAYASNFSDADGSAKVVLVAIERSMAAWLRLREILPSQEDTVLALLVLLQQLQRGTQVVLPGAATFRRPGFDPGPNVFDDD